MYSTLNRFSDLSCEPLLHLQSTGKYVHKARNLTEANYFTLGNVGNVDLANTRQKVVLAEAEHFDVLDDHHLVVSHVEHRAQQSFLGVLMVAFGQKLHR